LGNNSYQIDREYFKQNILDIEHHIKSEINLHPRYWGMTHLSWKFSVRLIGLQKAWRPGESRPW